MAIRTTHFKCMDDNGYWHLAAGPKCEDSVSATSNISNCSSALPEYIDIKHTMLFDTILEPRTKLYTTPSIQAPALHKYRSAERTVTEQVDVASGEVFHCRQTGGRPPVSWNVTDAKKVGESLATDDSGKIIRHFQINTTVSEIDFAFLTKSANVPYTGYYSVEYYDEKETGAPVKFTLPTREFIVTKYVEKQISMPPPLSSTWDPSASQKWRPCTGPHYPRKMCPRMRGCSITETAEYLTPWRAVPWKGSMSQDLSTLIADVSFKHGNFKDKDQTVFLKARAGENEDTKEVFGFKVKSLEFCHKRVEGISNKAIFMWPQRHRIRGKVPMGCNMLRVLALARHPCCADPVMIWHAKLASTQPYRFNQA